MIASKLVQPGRLFGFSLGKIPALLLAMAVVSAASCEACSQGGSGGSSSGGSWLVGESALMLNINHDSLGEIGHYDLQINEDLLGIACRGTREAWVVGAHGLLIATADAGGSWNVLDPRVAGDLRAVALALPNTVLVAGDGGVGLVSPDGGSHWRALAAPAVPWTSAALRKADGAFGLLVSATGVIARYDAATGAVSEVGRGGAALRSVVISRDGANAAAVGDAGQLLVSRDGGQSFAPRALGTGASLRDVWLIGPAGDRFVAVGEQGLVLEGPIGPGAVTTRSVGADASLRALHMQANGHGMIVGDRGAVFFTEDFGTSWARLPTDETRNILGVDALDFGAEHY